MLVKHDDEVVGFDGGGDALAMRRAGVWPARGSVRISLSSTLKSRGKRDR